MRLLFGVFVLCSLDLVQSVSKSSIIPQSLQEKFDVKNIVAKFRRKLMLSRRSQLNNPIGMFGPELSREQEAAQTEPQHNESFDRRRSPIRVAEQQFADFTLEAEPAPQIQFDFRIPETQKKSDGIFDMRPLRYNNVTKYRVKVFLRLLARYIEAFPEDELPDHLYLVDFFFPFRMEDDQVASALLETKGCLGVWKKYGSGTKVLFASLEIAFQIAKHFKPGFTPLSNPIPDGLVIEFNRKYYK
jgi:hypothetical protein